MFKKVFTVEIKGEKVELAVLMPNDQQSQDAQMKYREIFAKCIKKGILVRNALEKHLVEQGLWDKAREDKVSQLRRDIASRTDSLSKGGIKLSDAKKVAIEIRGLRNELRELVSEKTVLDSNTVEGLAENARLEFLVTQCTVYNSTGNKYYASLDAFYESGATEVSRLAFEKLMELIYGVNLDYEASLPENEFLVKWKFANEKLELVNAEGKRVDIDNRLIDEYGRFVDSDGFLIDENGNKINSDGSTVLESQPFLDDDGNPIVP